MCKHGDILTKVLQSLLMLSTDVPNLAKNWPFAGLVWSELRTAQVLDSSGTFVAFPKNLNQTKTQISRIRIRARILELYHIRKIVLY